MRKISALYTAKYDSETSADERKSFDSVVDEKMAHSLESSTTYWVHPDNEVETELFLLKHLTLQLPPSPLSSKDIQRSTRTAYLDSKDWKVYSSVVAESANQPMQVQLPQIQWEENSRNKDVLVLIPGQYSYTSLRLKRKTLTTFLSSQGVDLTSPEWEGKASSKEWRTTAQKVHDYVRSASLHPGILLLPTPLPNQPVKP